MDKTPSSASLAPKFFVMLNRILFPSGSISGQRCPCSLRAGSGEVTFSLFRPYFATRNNPPPKTTQLDIPIRAPWSPCCAVGDGQDLDHRSALDRNFLHPRRGQEPDPLPIWREERQARTFRPGDGTTLKLVHTAQIQHGQRRVAAAEYIGHTLTVG